MTDHRLSVEMLPARHGDALWIEWGERDDRRRMLIDGGPNQTYELIRERFEALDPDDRHVDLMVVTHVDLDHIGGSIKLLEDDDLGITYGDVWFNDYRHLGDGTEDRPAERGAMQGEVLAAILKGYGRPWNEAFDGRAIVVPSQGALPTITLAGGLKLVLLSPSPEKLADLRKTWEKTLKKKKLKPGEHAAAVLAEIEADLAVAERGRKTFGGDHSTANGSSIAFIAEYGSQRWLFAGDAHEDVLADALDRYGALADEMPVPLDGFKLPHHGSTKNMSEDLLSKIVCSRYLVSTDGSYFKHPDAACLDLLVETSPRPELVFNYLTEFNDKWTADSDDYTAVYPDGDGDGVGITTRVERSGESTPPMDEPQIAAAPSDGNRDSPADGDDRGLGTFGDAVIEAAPPEVPPLRVHVVHGSIDRAIHPVMVGHYRATPLSGAEEFLDRRMGRRLSDRLARDLYPDDIAQSLHVATPRRRHPAGGALVVGLGEYGELTPMRLAETIRSALLRYALDRADRHEGHEALELGISSVLVGATGDQGLNVSGSVRAIVAGVLEANRDLESESGGAPVRFSDLELWEYDPQHAELAFRAVPSHGTVQTRDSMHSRREVERPKDLTPGEGALTTSMPVDTDDATWRRLRVAERTQPAAATPPAATSPTVRAATAPPAAAAAPAAPGSGILELDYVVTGQLARAGVMAHRVEQRRLGRILRGMVGNHEIPDGLPTTLYELLLPNELKWDLMSASHIQLEVDEMTADIPWEMLAARNPRQSPRSNDHDGDRHDDRGALALRAPLVRQLRLDEVPAVRRASRPSALVIGNPPVGHLAETLKGAFHEAGAVADLLHDANRGYDVKRAIYPPDAIASDDTTLAIEMALFDRDYRIVHVAAHGFFNPDDPTRSGVAIGPDSFLTADVIGQLNVVPDVVFLNCCHVGAVTVGRDQGSIDFTRKHHNRLGASLARRLIERGVRAVVVAGWAVADTAAERFALKFYEQMLDGVAFGEAVHAARKDAHAAEPNHSTWGAYQCYGDGGYKLPIRRQEGRASPPETIREAHYRLERLVSSVESVGVEAARGGGHEYAVGEIAAIQTEARKRGWLDKGNGALCEQLGDAWAAIGEYETAINRYADGLEAEDGSVSLRAIEQLANMRDRRANQMRRGGSERIETIQEHLDESDRLLAILQQVSPTGERLALNAARTKRRAAAMDGDARLAALALAAAAYRDSYEAKRQPYTLLNFVQLEEIRSRIAGDASAAGEVEDGLDEALAAANRTASSDYWADIGWPDAHLTRAIVDDAVDERAAKLVELYAEVFDNRSRAVQRAATLDHLLDLAELHPDAQQSAALRSVYDTLIARQHTD